MLQQLLAGALMLANVGLCELPPQGLAMSPLATADNYVYTRYLETPKVDNSCAFADKDVKAAARSGRTLKQEAIEGAEPELRRRLYRFMTFEDGRGIRVGITALYRGNYRQSMTCGRNKSPVGHSFHGGTRVNGWGHGKAADLVILAPSRQEQLARNHLVWDDVDRFGKDFGLGRPYKDGDAMHVALIESYEFVVAKARHAKRVLWAKLHKKHQQRFAKHHPHKKKHSVRMASR